MLKHLVVLCNANTPKDWSFMLVVMLLAASDKDYTWIEMLTIDIFSILRREGKCAAYGVNVSFFDLSN